MLAIHQRFDRLNVGRIGHLVLGVAFCMLSAGCSICPSPYDYDYGTYGTKTPRTDMRHGRVGSLFSDPAYGNHRRSDGVIYQDSYEIPYGEGILGQEVIIDGEGIEGVVIEEVTSGSGEIIIQ